jgi:SSS family solute:Na+ symporter
MGVVLDYLVIAAYFAVLIGAGYWGLRRARNAEDFLVAGRSLGPLWYLGTLSAVVLGGASTIGGVSLGYQYGISGMWLVFMLGLGIIALAILLSTRLANLGVYTVSEMLAIRYGRSSRLISAIVMSTYDLMVAVTATIAIGTVFDVILGIPPAWAILLAGGIIVVYSVAGGMWSITLTDFLQFLVMTVGVFFILLPLAISRAGGFAGMRDTLPESYFNWTAIGGGTIFAYFLLFFFGIMIGQDIWQRVFTARSGNVARWGGIAAGGYCLAYGLVGALIGTAAKALLPDLSVADNAFAQVTKLVLPVGLTGLVLAAALAAVMSTASSCLLASATILANDVYAEFISRREHNKVFINRVSMLLVGVVVITISLLVKDVVGALTVAYDLLTGALFVPIVGALFWNRATSTGALAAMIVSSVVVVVLMATRGLFSNDPIIYGMLTSLVVFVAVSLLTPKPSQRRMAAWERRVKGGANVSEEE